MDLELSLVGDIFWANQQTLSRQYLAMELIYDCIGYITTLDNNSRKFTYSKL